MWWALLCCLFIPLILCEQATYSGSPETDPFAEDDLFEFCIDTPKIPSSSSHPSIEVIFEFESEVDSISVYWNNSTTACVGTSYLASKEIIIKVAHNGTSLCYWDIIQLQTGNFIGMVTSTSSKLTKISIIEFAEQLVDITIAKPCSNREPAVLPPSIYSHLENDSSSINIEEGGELTSEKGLISLPFVSELLDIESEIVGRLESDKNNTAPAENELITVFNFFFGLSLGACFITVVITLFFANCAFIGKKKKKPVFVSSLGEPETTYYLDYPTTVFPTDNDSPELFQQLPPIGTVHPELDATIDNPNPSTQFGAFHPTVLTKPIKYFNLLFLLKHVVQREPVTESI